MVDRNKVLQLLKLKISAKVYLSPYSLACIGTRDRVQAHIFWLAQQFFRPYSYAKIILVVIEKVFFKLDTICLVHPLVVNQTSIGSTLCQVLSWTWIFL